SAPAAAAARRPDGGGPEGDRPRRCGDCGLGRSRRGQAGQPIEGTREGWSPLRLQRPPYLARDQGRRPMQQFYVKPGDAVSFSKTVGESDVYLFAGITGDLAPNHVNEQYMARSKYGKRIAHGALLIGYASTCSTMMIDKCNGLAGDETAVS